MTSGSKRFFLGTDSAPHKRSKKECSCGCAGIYNAPVALSVYAKVFEEVKKCSSLFDDESKLRLVVHFAGWGVG